MEREVEKLPRLREKALKARQDNVGSRQKKPLVHRHLPKQKGGVCESN